MDLKHLSDHLLFTIEQISLLTGVRKSTLRYWEKSFHHCLNPSRTHSNRREYSLEDLDRIKTIKHLLEDEHLTSHGVRLRLSELFPPKPEAGRGRRPKPGEVGSSPSH
jgi:DNA-binding transcriptional MerR regulator